LIKTSFSTLGLQDFGLTYPANMEINVNMEDTHVNTPMKHSADFQKKGRNA
jgi:hypothetical protein